MIQTFHLTDPLLTILGPPGVTRDSVGWCGQQQHYYNTTAAARAARQQRCCCGIKSYKDNFHPGQLVSSGPGSNTMVGLKEKCYNLVKFNDHLSSESDHAPHFARGLRPPDVVVAGGRGGGL